MSKTKLLTEKKILRIGVDESWSSLEFSVLFDSINFLYKILIELDEIEKYKSLVKKIEHLSLTDFMFKKLDGIEIIDGELYKKLKYSNTSANKDLINDFTQEFTKPFLKADFTDNKVLNVLQIKYASPGFADLVGIRKIVEQILDLFKYYFPNEETKLKTALLEQDLITKKIENLKLLGVSDKELQKLLDVRNSAILNIKNLKLLDKITKVEIKELE